MKEYIIKREFLPSIFYNSGFKNTNNNNNSCIKNSLPSTNNGKPNFKAKEATKSSQNKGNNNSNNSKNSSNTGNVMV